MRQGSLVVDWVLNFMQNRINMAVYKRAHSNLREITSGVIRGAVIEPLIFSAYINDLPRRFKYSCMFMFTNGGKAIV